MKPLRIKHLIATGALATLGLAGAGVAGATTPPSEPTDTTAMTEGSMAPEAAGPTGPLCAAVPAEGTGSVDSMAAQPVATAASENPLLTTLVAAVTAAELGDTLNSGGPFTVLAPINSAFDKVDPATMEAAMGDPTGLLSTVLTYHVIPEQLSAADLAGGSFATVQGEEVSFEMVNDTLVINGGAAAAQCVDVPTANATVLLIDSVLMPPSMAEAAAPTDTATTDTMMTDTTAAG